MLVAACPTCGTPFDEGETGCRYDGTPRESEPTQLKDPVIGTTLGDYRVDARLGMGGMGIVYRGVQPVIQKRVAIKVLRPDLAADPVQVQRLVQEAQAVNAIRHRGIIDIFGFGRLPDGRHYIVMEELEGEPMDAYIAREAPVGPAIALGFLDELLSALAAAHARGVIHRDLKPNNLFLVTQPDGSRYVKVLDFGLAKRAGQPGGRAAQTSELVVSGTPEYMAPEQARGEPVGPETDLYAVGCITYELLTGELPFTGATPVDILTQHLTAPVRPPSTRVASVPRELDAVVERLLEKDRTRRPSQAESVRAELKRLAKALASAATQVHAEHAPAVPFAEGSTRVVAARVRPPPAAALEPVPAERSEDVTGATDPAAPPRSVRRLVAGAGAVALLAAVGAGALLVQGRQDSGAVPVGAAPARTAPTPAGPAGPALDGPTLPGLGGAEPRTGPAPDEAGAGQERTPPVGSSGTLPLGTTPQVEAVAVRRPGDPAEPDPSSVGSATGQPRSASPGGAGESPVAPLGGTAAPGEAAGDRGAPPPPAAGAAAPAPLAGGRGVKSAERPLAAPARLAASAEPEASPVVRVGFDPRAALEARIGKLEQRLRAATEPGEDPDAAALALLRKQKLELTMAKTPEQVGRVAKTLDEWQRNFLR